MPARFRILLVGCVVPLAVACTDETGADPTPAATTISVGGAADTTVAITVAPTTAAPSTAAPATTIIVPEGPPVAPGALRVTLGDTYVDGETILPAGPLTFDVWNGGDADHALRIVNVAGDEVMLETRTLPAQEWEILDVDLGPGVYRFETDTASIDVSVTG